VEVELAPDFALFVDGPCVGLEVVELLQVVDLPRFVHFYVRHVGVGSQSQNLRTVIYPVKPGKTNITAVPAL
jgi:hypothetical protein